MELQINNASGKILLTCKSEDMTEEVADKLRKDFDEKGVWKYSIIFNDKVKIKDCHNIMDIEKSLIDILEITLNE